MEALQQFIGLKPAKYIPDVKFAPEDYQSLLNNG